MFIQTEETPNPATLKFLPGKTIISKGTLEFKNKSEAKDFELARNLFAESNVKNVFFGKDFITVSKSSNVEWDELKPSVLSIILDFFSSGGNIENMDLTEKPQSEKIKYFLGVPHQIRRLLIFFIFYSTFFQLPKILIF